MFGNLFEKLEEQKEAIRRKLESEQFRVSDPDGKVTVIVSGARKIIEVTIAEDLEDREQLEDLLIVLINDALDKASVAEAELTQESIRDMMPPGFDALSNLFNR